jgi:hypothetical protein
VKRMRLGPMIPIHACCRSDRLPGRPLHDLTRDDTETSQRVRTARRYELRELLPSPSTGGGHKTDTSETTRATSHDADPASRTSQFAAKIESRVIARVRDGKEGVNGSSPLEGSAKAPHVGAFAFTSTCRLSRVRWVWSRLWSF